MLQTGSAQRAGSARAVVQRSGGVYQEFVKRVRGGEDPQSVWQSRAGEGFVHVAACVKTQNGSGASAYARSEAGERRGSNSGITGALRECACRRCAAVRVREAFTTTILVREVRQFEECAGSWRVS